MKNIEKKVKEIVENLLKETEVKLVNVEFVSESGEKYLRVYIDKKSGIEISDCVDVSKKLSKILDEQDFIEMQYYLEVSSPGIKDVVGDEGGKIE